MKMVIRQWITWVFVAFVFFTGSVAFGQEAVQAEKPQQEVKTQTTCPVMGGTIDKNLYVDHEGKRIYLCCQGCADAVKKEPEKYIKKLEDEGITLDKTPKLQTKCPMMNRPIDKKLYVDHQGKRIYLCCKGCVATVKKDPGKYIKQLEAEGVTLDKAPEEKKQKAE